MGRVISLDSKMPHYAGPCVCLECKHKWEGVWLERHGVTALECPECGLFKGVCEGLVMAKKGSPVFTCMECTARCQQFTIIPGPPVSAMCCYCGYEHDIDALKQFD